MQHHSTFDFNVIRAWVRLVVQFVDSAFENKRVIRPFPDKKCSSLSGRNYQEKFTTRRKLDLFFYDVVEDADLYEYYKRETLSYPENKRDPDKHLIYIKDSDDDEEDVDDFLYKRR